MAKKTVLEIEGRLDPTKILQGLKEIRNEMQKQGAKQSLFKNIDKDIETATNLFNDFKASAAQGIDVGKDVKNLNRIFDSLSRSISRITVGLENIAQDSNNFGVNTQKISKLVKQINDLSKQEERLKTNIQTNFSNNLSNVSLNENERNQISSEIEDYQRLEEAIKNVAQARESRYRKAMTNYVSGNSSAISAVDSISTATGDVTTDGHIKEVFKASITAGDSLEATMQKIFQIVELCGVTISDVESFTSSISSDYSNIINAARDSSSSSAKGQITKNIINNQQLGFTDSNQQMQLNATGQSLLPSAQSYQELANVQNTLARQTQQLADARNTYDQSNQNAADNAVQAIQNQRNAYNQIRQTYRETINDINETQSAQEKLDKSFSNAKSIIKNVLSVSSAYSGLKKIFRDTFEDIKRLDQAFGSIAMVTSKSLDDLWGSYSEYAAIANKLGQSTEDAIKSSALFYQQGLDTEQSLTLTESTMKLATLSGQGFEEATKQMTAALRGFHMEMEQGSHVTDVYSELAANAAADVHGIAYAMSKTASIASSAGMEFETTAAFLANMIETTQEAPKLNSLKAKMGAQQETIM